MPIVCCGLKHAPTPPQPEEEVPKGCGVMVVDENTTAHLLLAGILDVDKELVKLGKKQEDLKSKLQVGGVWVGVWSCCMGWAMYSLLCRGWWVLRRDASLVVHDTKPTNTSIPINLLYHTFRRPWKSRCRRVIMLHAPQRM